MHVTSSSFFLLLHFSFSLDLTFSSQSAASSARPAMVVGGEWGVWDCVALHGASVTGISGCSWWLGDKQRTGFSCHAG